jgi:hypothetical protein
MKVRRPARSRSRDRILTVEEGQVVCPRRGPVDIEWCWVCPAYDGLSAGASEGVVCRSTTMEPLVLRSVDM